MGGSAIQRSRRSRRRAAAPTVLFRLLPLFLIAFAGSGCGCGSCQEESARDEGPLGPGRVSGTAPATGEPDTPPAVLLVPGRPEGPRAGQPSPGGSEEAGRAEQGDRELAEQGARDPVATWRRLTDRDEQVRERALEELARSGTPQADALMEDFLLRESDPTLRLRAVEMLELREPGRAVEALGRGLNDPDPEVRMASAEALEAVGTREAILTLWAAAGQEGDSDVRESVLDALHSLGEDVERYRD